jgi:hypothetical protein
MAKETMREWMARLEQKVDDGKEGQLRIERKLDLHIDRHWQMSKALVLAVASAILSLFVAIFK